MLLDEPPEEEEGLPGGPPSAAAPAAAAAQVRGRGVGAQVGERAGEAGAAQPVRLLRLVGG